MSKLDVDQLEHAYIMVYENASELLEEANILYDNERYARAYFLAQIAHEEIGKLPMILHEATRAANKEAHDWKKFYKRLRSHNAKNQINVIFDNVLEEPDFNWDFKEIKNDVKRLNILKNASLYSDLDENKFVKPSAIVNKGSADSRIKAVEAYMRLMTSAKLHEPGIIESVTNVDSIKKVREIMRSVGIIE